MSVSMLSLPQTSLLILYCDVNVKQLEDLGKAYPWPRPLRSQCCCILSINLLMLSSSVPLLTWVYPPFFLFLSEQWRIHPIFLLFQIYTENFTLPTCHHPLQIIGIYDNLIWSELFGRMCVSISINPYFFLTLWGATSSKLLLLSKFLIDKYHLGRW